MQLLRPRTIVYAVLAVLLTLEALWGAAPKPADPSDDVEISAARRIPQTASVEDAIY